MLDKQFEQLIMTENKTTRIIAPESDNEECGFDITLRPQSLSEFVGQEQIKENLNIFMEAARRRNEPIEHVLLYGPPGLGKTTLAHIIAREMGANMKVTTGPAIEKSGDLAALLTNLEPGDVLFIDEIHRLNRVIEEILYSAMEDFVLDIIIGKGPSAKTLRIDLPHFTLIGATTKLSKISSPLRDRFGNTYRLDFYEDDDINKIVKRSANILNVPVNIESSSEIAKRSRKTPRIANRLLKRVRDFAEVKNNGQITPELVRDTLAQLGIDELGLDHVDRRILQTIIEKFAGGPVGLNTIAAATSEEMEAIEDVYEPFLLQLGFINRTNRGRIITDKAYEHLKIKKEI
ncbi:MAG: Holliday junction ATP-dependent DNA helicase RuvB [Parcubacteria group bacterium GW2011_GWC2_39_14]|nr:MAG: Holliday junction ATP-dependent DNA helicase RuvB [Parcubacteria group bacterium GW2011_GWC2_39_14]KKR55231.1 MAG: Holliday junction ATP-dependent DNA helicase RuvB [Parcubacteria group bacterium GW2011_GWA2_40_23]